MSITISGTGAITGVSTNYSFDKSVSIAGTVTYEDVTNVDSVGIITARSGVHFGTAASGTLVSGDSSGIGIGTDNPDASLHIETDGASTVLQLERTGAPAKIISSFGGGDSAFKYTVNNAGSFKLGIDDSDGDRFKLSFGSADNAEFGTNDFFTVSTAGDVGIGITSPALKLHVQDSVSQIIRFSRTAIGAGSLDVDADGNAVFNSHTTNKSVVFHTQATEKARIDSDGRLLVGLGATDTNANTILQGSSGGSTGAARLFLQRGSAPANGQAMGDIYFADEKGNQGAAIRSVRDGGTWTQGSSHPTRLSIQTTADSDSTPTEHISITSAGKIMCGEATPLVSATANGVEVHCSTAGGALVLRNTNATAGNYWRIGPENNNTLIIYNQGGVGQFMTSGGTSWSANSSDLRVKDVVGDLNQTTSWNVLKGLQIKEWWFKNESTEHRSENTPHIGPIAQELHALDPNLRLESPSGTTPATFGQTFDGPVYTYDNDLLIKHALSALNQAIAKIETLETQNADLLARVTALEGN